MRLISWLQILRPTRLRAYASTSSLPRPPQGSLPVWVGSPFTGRVSHPLDDEQSFMMSPHHHSPLTSLIWNDLLSSRHLSMGFRHWPASVSWVACLPPITGRAWGPGAPWAPPCGREALEATLDTWYGVRPTGPGPRRRRTTEGASTTSHTDIRWLPRRGVAAHV